MVYFEPQTIIVKIHRERKLQAIQQIVKNLRIIASGLFDYYITQIFIDVSQEAFKEGDMLSHVVFSQRDLGTGCEREDLVDFIKGAGSGCMRL